MICDAPTLAREAARRGAHVTLLPTWGHGPLCPAPIRARVRELLRRHSVRLVHANMPSVLPAVVPVARTARIPVVAHLHIATTESERLHSLLHQTTAAIGVAEHVVADLRAEGMPTDRVRVIANAVDVERLAVGDASGLRGELGIPEEAFVAASVGSLIRRKGHDVTLRAVATARTTGADVRLLICGDGEEEDALRALAAELGITSSVYFLGLRRDVGAVLRDAADVYLSAARDEALPLNVLEAQWAGLPVIASDIPAHHEALLPGTTGVLVPGEQPAGFADALLALHADPALRDAYGATGQTLVAQRFSMPAYVGAFESLYGELLATPPAAHGWVRGSRWPRAYNQWLLRVARRRLRR